MRIAEAQISLRRAQADHGLPCPHTESWDAVRHMDEQEKA